MLEATHFARVAFVALAILAGCAPKTTDTAEKLTRAISAGDTAGTIAPMDAELRKRVTDEGLGELPAAMRKLGTLQSFTLSKADADARKYEYVAKFDTGSMNVDVAFDAEGKVSDFHVFDGD